VDINAFRDLLTLRGQRALQAASALEPREVDFLAHFTTLSRQFPPELARAALETAILRLEAVAKFPFASQMYFTREAMEQASAHEVSVYRSERFRGFRFLADLGCSIGADSLSLAPLAPVAGIDLDPLRLVMARENLKAMGLDARGLFLHANLKDPLPLEASPDLALFFDPARRSAGRRVHSVRDYLPPLSIIREWLDRYPALGVKISPGVRLEELSSYSAEIEFISLNGNLKEAVLWFGPLTTASHRATVLPGPHTLALPAIASQGAGSGMHDQPTLPLSEPLEFLYEPDASVLRAGLVETLGAQLGAAQLDPDIAYLTADNLKPTPFARAWKVEDWFPFGMKRLRSALRQRGVGRVVVKKRGSPLQPEALIRDLRLKGEHERVVFLTHLRGRPIVILSTAELEISPPV
jgi:hypothetical protein